MLIYRCDRCEKLMNKPAKKVESTTFTKDVEIKKYELCSDCAIGFAKFIQGVKTNEVDLSKKEN